MNPQMSNSLCQTCGKRRTAERVEDLDHINRELGVDSAYTCARCDLHNLHNVPAEAVQ
jgi:hypothetical protein